MPNTTRRGFLAGIGTLCAGAVALNAPQREPPQPPAELRAIDELQLAAKRLEERLAQPVTLNITLDGKQIADRVVPLLPTHLDRFRIGGSP